MENFPDAQGQLTHKSLVHFFLNFEPIRDIMVVLVTCKNKEEPIKNEGDRVVTDFPHYIPMGAICCHGNQSSDPI